MSDELDRLDATEKAVVEGALNNAKRPSDDVVQTAPVKCRYTESGVCANIAGFCLCRQANLRSSHDALQLMPHGSGNDDQMFGAMQQIRYAGQGDQGAEKFTSGAAAASGRGNDVGRAIGASEQMFGAFEQMLRANQQARHAGQSD